LRLLFTGGAGFVATSPVLAMHEAVAVTEKETTP
jgi:hypothetical protein